MAHSAMRDPIAWLRLKSATVETHGCDRTLFRATISTPIMRCSRTRIMPYVISGQVAARPTTSSRRRPGSTLQRHEQLHGGSRPSPGRRISSVPRVSLVNLLGGSCSDMCCRNIDDKFATIV